MKMVPSPSDFALQETDLLHALDKATARDVDFADMYIESSVSESISMEESLVKRAVKSIEQGQAFGPFLVSGRVLRIPMIYPERIWKSLRRRLDILRIPHGDQSLAVTHQERPSRNLYPLSQSPSEISTQERVELLMAIDVEARKYDSVLRK